MPLPPERKRLLARTAAKVLEEIDREWDENHAGADIAHGNLEVTLLTTEGKEISCKASFASIETPNPLPPFGVVVLVSWHDAGVMYGRLTDTGDTIWPGGWETRSSMHPVDVWRPGRKPDRWAPVPSWLMV